MTTIEKKSVNTGKYVDTKYVDTMIRTYKQERWVHNSERIGKEDSLTVWMDLEKLEEFISQIKMHGGNGIRICFGAHPNEFENTDLAGRQTAVLVATRGTESQTNKDLYIADEGKANILAYGWLPACPPMCGTGYTTPGTAIIDRGTKGLSVI